MEMFSVRIDNKKKKKYMKKWLNTLPEYQSKRRLIIMIQRRKPRPFARTSEG